jgi:hypothetical protein
MVSAAAVIDGVHVDSVGVVDRGPVEGLSSKKPPKCKGIYQPEPKCDLPAGLVQAPKVHPTIGEDQVAISEVPGTRLAVTGDRVPVPVEYVALDQCVGALGDYNPVSSRMAVAIN